MASVTTNACSESRDNGYKVEIKFDEKPLIPIRSGVMIGEIIIRNR